MLLPHEQIHPEQIRKIHGRFSTQQHTLAVDIVKYQQREGLDPASNRGHFGIVMAERIKRGRELGIIGDGASQPGSIVGNDSSGKLVSAGVGNSLLW